MHPVYLLENKTEEDSPTTGSRADRCRTWKEFWNELHNP